MSKYDKLLFYQAIASHYCHQKLYKDGFSPESSERRYQKKSVITPSTPYMALSVMN